MYIPKNFRSVALILAAFSDLCWLGVQVARCEGVSEVRCKASLGPIDGAPPGSVLGPGATTLRVGLPPHSSRPSAGGGVVGEACYMLTADVLTCCKTQLFSLVSSLSCITGFVLHLTESASL